MSDERITAANKAVVRVLAFFISFGCFSYSVQAQNPTWTQLFPLGSQPGARFYHTAVYDPGTNKMIIFGGDNFGSLNDLWILSNANGIGGTPTWTQPQPAGGPPPPRAGHTAIYDTAANRMVVFGGRNSTGVLNDVWLLTNANGEGGTPTWTQLTSAGGPPNPRSGHTAVYNQATNRMIVFGGDGTGGTFNDLWVLSNANGNSGTPTWTQLIPVGGPPQARSQHIAVYNPTANRMIIFGGNGLNDLWILKNANGVGGTATWIAPAFLGTLPPGMSGHSAIYDAITDTMLVMGLNQCCFGQVWKLANASGLGMAPTWSFLAPDGGPPPPLFGHTAVYDRTTDRMIVFAGDTHVSLPVNQTWVLRNAIPVVVEGFDYPIGPPYVPIGTRVTEENDGDGWYVAQNFGEPNPNAGGKRHLGEDWNSERGASDDLGKPVYAAAFGTVIYAQDAGSGWNGVIIIHHQAPSGAYFVLPDGRAVAEVWTMYAHLDVTQINHWVTVGNTVAKNIQVGIIGPTPTGSTGPHLHFEIRYINPPDLVGPGYSFDTVGWVDPSDFLDINRGGMTVRPPTLTFTFTGCTTCRTGDRFTVQAHVTNPGSRIVTVEVKGGVRLPDGTPVNLMGSKHLEVSLPAGLNTTLTLFEVPSLPAGLPTGPWTFEGTLLGPDLGETFSREVKPFEVVP